MTIALLFSLGTCIVQIQRVRVNSLSAQKDFSISRRSRYHCSQCASVYQVRNISFEHQNNSFFLSFVQGVYIFEESPKSIQDVIGNVYCPGEYFLNRENCEFFGGYVTTPRSIYGCGKCGAWLFVHRVPFTLQEHVWKTKSTKTRFFSANKYEFVTRQTIVH